ncbi:MAG TPA: sodium:solute symporter family protein [Syntrophorhabdaceae bacterium]|nr:sodium:solute symporter family protein [Syntrophorhabdaceae bacterium]
MNAKYLPIPEITLTMAITSSVGIAILLGISILLGILGKKQWKSFDEYLVGKRDMGPFVTGCALAASYLSGWAFCGSTGITYTVGFSGMWFAGMWSLIGIIPCIWVASAKTRSFAVKLNATTVPELMGRRYESKMLQTVISICMLFFLFIYSVGQLKAAGGVWYAVTGFPPVLCLLLGVFIAWIYMVLGGYVGTNWSMAFQGAFLGIVGAIFGVWALVSSGGFQEISMKLWQQDPKLLQLIRPDLPKVGPTEFFSSWVGLLASPLIFFTMAIGFPHNLGRFLGMKKMNKKEYWFLVFIVWFITGIPVMLASSTNGLITRTLFGPQLFKIEPWKADLAAPLLSYTVGGIPLQTLYVMGLFAATLSTLAGMVMIMSANVTRDIITLWWPSTKDRTLIRISYFLIALFLFLPFYWTWKRPPELLSMFMGLAAMGLGAIFFFVTAMSFYWKRATKWGAFWTVLYGTLATLFGGYLVFTKKVVGMATMEFILLSGCLVLFFGVSLFTKPPSGELIKKLFEGKDQ